MKVEMLRLYNLRFKICCKNKQLFNFPLRFGLVEAALNLKSLLLVVQKTIR